MESTMALSLGDDVEIDMTYFDKLQQTAEETIGKYVRVEEFVE
jgi:hypothetical protein